MNISVYLFGDLSNGYTQYPNDYASTIFKTFYNNSQATTQVAIRRDGDLMYYGYIRKLDDNSYIGFCTVINGKIITEIDSLFSLYESIIETMVKNGYLIHYDDKGNIVSKVGQLYENREEIDLLTLQIQTSFDRLESSSKLLPAVSYSIERNSVKNYSIQDEKDEIIKSSHTNGYTFIYKSKGYDTAQMKSYKSILSRISDENLKLRQENTKLEELNQKIIKQKKQFKNVILLIILVLGCGLGIYFLYASLYKTQGKLDDANSKILQKDDIIKNKDNRIDGLFYSIDSLKNEYYELNKEKKEIESRFSYIRELYPFFVTDCSVSKYSFTFDYYSLEEKTLTVSLIAINEDDKEYLSNNHTITVNKGKGTITLNFYDSLYVTDNYTVVLMYNGSIIAGKRW